MPRREGVDALGLPIMMAPSRSRPGSSNAVYSYGGTPFAGSSSSLVNSSMRDPTRSDPNLAAFIVSSQGSGSGPVAATEAPHLSSAESFFGRMTLTAPDNMRRKKAEEREKKKQIRKRRAEKGANAAASLAIPTDVGPSHLPSTSQNIATNVIASGLTTAAEQLTSRRRKRPTLPTTNSGVNLQTYTLEQSRSRSPTRPVRPQSGPNSQSTSRQASPERRQVRRRDRVGSDASAISGDVVVAAPIYQHTSETEERSQPTTQQLASLPTAAQQRRDIYADLDTLGLPGADESDLEDQPPPFPTHATRPISPPRMPEDGQEWTEEMRRRQEEYEMNRPPDSPPPAFRSDDEGRHGRNESEQLSSSDEESISEEITTERQEWEDDVTAGFSLEERIERDRLRREARNEPMIEVDFPAIVTSVQDGALVQDASVRQMDNPGNVGEDGSEGLLIANVSTNVHEQPREQQGSSIGQVIRLQEHTEVQDSPIASLNIGQLVMEARARRATSAATKLAKETATESRHSLQTLQQTDSPAQDSILPAGRSFATLLQNDPSLPMLGASLPLQSALSRHLQQSTSQPLLRAASQPSLEAKEVVKPSVLAAAAALVVVGAESHRQVSIPSTTPTLMHHQAASYDHVEPSEPAPTNPIVTAGPSRQVEPEKKKVRSIKTRPKPSGESHSRFRDGASAAANRRMALWGPSAPTPTPALRVDDEIGRIQREDKRYSSHDTSNVQMAESLLQPVRQSSSSGISGSISAQDSDNASSSDSDVRWEKEEAAFQALQHRLAPPIVAEDDSSSEEEDNFAVRKTNQRPGWFRSNSIDLAKPGSGVPKAPPPLVLGRSRGGGAEYSSSSDSSSESGINRMDEDSDDDSLSPIEVDELASSQARPSLSVSNHSLDKGKQPIRPPFFEADRTVSAHVPSVRATATPAGDFEEDTGSSHDFASDEGEQGHVQESMRPPVGNRLKTLFSMPLGNASHTSSVAPPTASRASIGNLFEKQIDATSSQASKQPVPTSTALARSPSLHKQPSDKSLRAKEWANAYATLEAKQQRDPISEQQARGEALEQISRLQLAGVSSNAPSTFNKDSLDALERLLSRKPYVSGLPSTSGQNGEEGRAGLRRSGAISRPTLVAPFVNPRSSIAPRPLGRLPTITNATRHFPPSRQAMEEPASTSFTGHASSSTTPRHRQSVIDSSTNWMTHIPESENIGLPEPLEPVKQSRMSSTYELPPPLPLRSSNSRVSAMVERFEGQSARGSDVLPSSPSRDQLASTMPSNSSITREVSLRRRPPPPPPPSSTQQRQSRPVSTSVDSMPSTPSFQPLSSSQEESHNFVVPLKPFKPPALQDNNRHSISQQQSLQSLSSSQTAPFPAYLEGSSREQPALPPRIRPRPLPIPPNVKPSASFSRAVMQQPSIAQPMHESSANVDQEENSDDDEVESTSPTAIRRGSDSSIPATAIIHASTRDASLGYTDLELFASRLADGAPADGNNYEDLHLIAEFLGPAKSTGATSEEVEALSVGIVEVLRKRVVGKKENGKDKVKVSLQLMGVKVERCGVCLLQFKQGNLGCLFPCLHVLHEDCAAKLLRDTKLCPTCRLPIA